MLVRLIHWNEQEAQDRALRLGEAGYEVDSELLDGAALMRAVKSRPPRALIIDLSRLPSHGRDVALAIRNANATRAVPIVFVDGADDKVTKIRQLLPDAEYTTWPRIASSVRRAIAHPPESPIVPGSNLAGYSGTPLVRKLGVKAGMVVAMIGAPEGFPESLAPLPEYVTLRYQARGRCDLVIWFCQKQSDYRRRLQRLSELTKQGDIWVAWPKAAAGRKTDLTQQVVREYGLSMGLVDYKICAIDAIWSALRFTRRKKK